MDYGNTSILVALDLSAAFDTIDHQIMLNRLSQTYGITGNALKWMESYLSDRYQTVVVDGVKSKPMPLNYGLPQGATLAAKGFNLYVKPLGDIIQKHNLPHKAYADDTNLYISFKTKDKVSKRTALIRLEACLKEIVS